MGYQAKALVVVPRAEARKYMEQPGTRNWVSIIETIGIEEKTIPPFLIFTGQNHQLQWYPRQAPKNWMYGISENGWTDDEMALHWLKKHFEPKTGPIHHGVRWPVATLGRCYNRRHEDAALRDSKWATTRPRRAYSSQ